MAAGRPRKAKAPKGYQLAEVFPQGEVLVDHVYKKPYVLGKHFASGGFGRIYECFQNGAKSPVFAAKMEPADNGPLFQEMATYRKLAKPEHLEAWKAARGLKFLGVPPMIAGGKHMKNGNEYRFLIMSKYGANLEDVLKCMGQAAFPAQTSFRIALTCIDILEFMSSKRYVHADIKSENLLLADAKKPATAQLDSGNRAKIYLVDFGLASAVAASVDEKGDPRKAHNGTLIFTSIDAHCGRKASFRGDAEILGYNLVFWLTGSLPWAKFTNPDMVQKGKERWKSNTEGEIAAFLDRHGLDDVVIQGVVTYFDSVFSTSYATIPDYDLLRNILESSLSLTPNPKKRRSAGSPSRTGARARLDSPVLRSPASKRLHEQRNNVVHSDSGDLFDVSTPTTSTAAQSLSRKPLRKEARKKSPSPTKTATTSKPSTSKTVKKATRGRVAKKAVQDSGDDYGEEDWDPSSDSTDTSQRGKVVRQATRSRTTKTLLKAKKTKPKAKLPPPSPSNQPSTSTMNNGHCSGNGSNDDASSDDGGRGEVVVRQVSTAGKYKHRQSTAAALEAGRSIIPGLGSRPKPSRKSQFGAAIVKKYIRQSVVHTNNSTSIPRLAASKPRTKRQMNADEKPSKESTRYATTRPSPPHPSPGEGKKASPEVVSPTTRNAAELALLTKIKARAPVHRKAVQATTSGLSAVSTRSVSTLTTGGLVAQKTTGVATQTSPGFGGFVLRR